MKFNKVKEVAQYFLEHELPTIEIEHLNGHIYQLINEVYLLDARSKIIKSVLLS